MTKTEDRAAAERRTMERYEARLAKAYFDGYASGRVKDGGALAAAWGPYTLKILRASAAALYPGRQNRRHLLPALGKMVTAACRVIRRGGS